MTKNLNPALARNQQVAQNEHRGNTPTWVLLCDSGSYKLFVNNGIDDGLTALDSEQHAVPKAGDLVSNQRGRNKASAGNDAHHAYGPPTDSRKKEKNDFIVEVAERMNARVADFTRLIVSAPPSALHSLREALSPAVQAKIVGELNKDLMHENASTLPHFIKEFMDLKNPEDYMQNGASQTGAA